MKVATYKYLIVLLGCIAICIGAIKLFYVNNSQQTATAQRLSRDYQVDLLINQAGYLPGSSKIVTTRGSANRPFEVINAVTNQVIFSDEMKASSGDFGTFATGDFSQVCAEGTYYIRADTVRSYPFRISSIVYDQALDLIVSYFSRQRCGGSETGYLTPCHLDDGVRLDNGKYQDVTGGWHDASDLRKWVGATIYGMIGMAKVYELSTGIDKEKLLDELLWGNRYFLNMQEPQGYIMSYIGGDVWKHSDSNRWTDNIIGEEGGEVHFAKPNAGKSSADMLIAGTKDDRIIKTEPLDIMGQYNFITAEAIMARILKENNPDYANRCLNAAVNCFKWCADQKFNAEPGIIGSSIQASLELFKTTGETVYSDFAVSQAGELLKFQDYNDAHGLSGYYYTETEKKTPYRNIWNGCMEFYALCDLALTFKDHSDTDTWKQMIAGYANNYLKTICVRNNFGIAPFGVFTDQDPGGNRKIGDLWYRYTMQPNPEWWVGINANLAASGIGLLKASYIMKDEKLLVLAQRQLDWIIGSNPFNSSTLIGIGYNHPKHFPGSTYYPQTPVIPGAVMNGLGGDEKDSPELGTGNWQISEYWTPMVAYTLWLMAELSDRH